MEYIASLRNKALSSNIEESVEGIEQLVKIVDDVTSILIKSIEVSKDRLITTEKISMAFNNYIKSLEEYLNSSNDDMAFWAASLMAHHYINDANAEKILLNAIKNGNLDYATTATTILCRTKSKNVKEAISERLKDLSMSEKIKGFFKEKLSDLSSIE